MVYTLLNKREESEEELCHIVIHFGEYQFSTERVYKFDAIAKFILENQDKGKEFGKLLNDIERKFFRWGHEDCAFTSTRIQELEKLGISLSGKTFDEYCNLFGFTAERVLNLCKADIESIFLDMKLSFGLTYNVK